MGRHHHSLAVLQQRGLVGRRRGLALHHRIGLDDFHHHMLRQAHRDRVALYQIEVQRHAVLEIRRRVADQRHRQGRLFVGFGVHHIDGVVFAVEEGAGLFVDHQLFDGFLGAIALIALQSRLHVAHLDLDEGAALAGLQDIDFEHAPLLAVMLDDMAGSDGVGLDLHGLKPYWNGR